MGPKNDQKNKKTHTYFIWAPKSILEKREKNIT